MLKAPKPKNARSKRVLDNREPKLVENVKTALFIPGSNCNATITNAMADLPDSKKFQKKNAIVPFEDASSLEFFSQKNDTSLLVVGSHNKKRPNNLTFVRTFNYSIYDMLELRLESFKLLRDFRKQTFNIGMKPMFVFNGPVFDSHVTFKHVKSLFLDFFRGQVTDVLDVAGLQHIIAISADEIEENMPLPKIYLRVYLLKTLKSNVPKQPRVELDEIGPRFDFIIGRSQEPDAETEKEAFKRPRQLEPKSKKNVETDILGDKVGRVHLEKQDFGKLQTRKMKGLKKRFDQADNDDDQDQEEDDINDIEEEKPTKKSRTE